LKLLFAQAADFYPNWCALIFLWTIDLLDPSTEHFRLLVNSVVIRTVLWSGQCCNQDPFCPDCIPLEGTHSRVLCSWCFIPVLFVARFDSPKAASCGGRGFLSRCLFVSVCKTITETLTTEIVSEGMVGRWWDLLQILSVYHVQWISLVGWVEREGGWGSLELALILCKGCRNWCRSLSRCVSRWCCIVIGSWLLRCNLLGRLWVFPAIGVRTKLARCNDEGGRGEKFV
jgi:hypothetical protein